MVIVGSSSGKLFLVNSLITSVDTFFPRTGSFNKLKSELIVKQVLVGAGQAMGQ